MLLNFSFDIEKSKNILADLPAWNELDCQNGISHILTMKDYESAEIRWLGLIKDGEIVCQSAPVGIDLSQRYAEHKQNEKWSFLATKTMDIGDSLLLAHQRNGIWYLADINPLQPNAISRFACKQCTAYSITLHGIHDLQIPMVGALDGPPIISQIATSRDGENTATIKIYASQAYLDYYRHFGWLASIFISLLLASILSFAIHRLLSAQNSFQHLVQEGLRHRQFVPFYQPIVDSRTGELLGAEALVRWIGSKGKIIPPAEFIPFAEESGLILPMTQQLSEQVIEDLKIFGWVGSEQFVSINFVPEHIYDDRFCDWFIELLYGNGLSGKNISVEITERRKFDDLEKGRKNLSRLVDKGIDIKLDDAGTGYGGFSYVQELPIATLKIDKMFIDTLNYEDDVKTPVLNAIINFAKNAGLEMIAEGVESTEQVNRLASMGVFAIQGYVYGKPMGCAEFIKWMNSRQ